MVKNTECYKTIITALALIKIHTQQFGNKTWHLSLLTITITTHKIPSTELLRCVGKVS